MRLVLSPVGTSILSFNAGQDRNLIFAYANSKEEEIPTEDLRKLKSIQQNALASLQNGDIKILRDQSAELNGIIGIYDGQLPANSSDVHFLIATDTFLGQIAADIVRQILSNHFPDTQYYIPRGMNTKEKDDFQSGIKELLNFCDKTLKGYKENPHYKIIFNLTGGFKSLQGYLNTIGMFYADRIVYIFERSNELITIPRLPIELNSKVFIDHAAQFLLLNIQQVGVLSRYEVEGIPNVMLEEYEKDTYILSNWGKLAWDLAKEAILSNQLIELPMIQYLNSFCQDFKKIDRSSDKIRLQEAIADIAFQLLVHNGDISRIKAGNSGGKLYSNYRGENNHLGHFRISQGLRVSCEYVNERLLLRHYGEHDYVNDNP